MVTHEDTQGIYTVDGNPDIFPPNENYKKPLSKGCRCLMVTFQIFYIIFHLGMIVSGSIYFNDCKQEKKIPIYLVCAGLTGILTVLVAMCGRHNNTSIGIKVTMVFFACGILAWYVVGSYWVYKAFPYFNDQKDDEFCNEIVFYVAFGVLLVPLITIFVISCVICCRLYRAQ